MLMLSFLDVHILLYNYINKEINILRLGTQYSPSPD